ncbi:MAG: PHP domain-containing protein [Clostridiaceae bacterium]|jgi:histidinol phosphatase-like PHP family hydrolase|nr:PHP domain-containing protein [Clostridiaceae bacterium]
MKSKVNFHIHTTHSDGGKTPAEVVALLKAAGVRYFAITDHDKVAGNIEAATLAKEAELEHINGIELSCCFADGEIGLDESFIHSFSAGDEDDFELESNYTVKKADDVSKFYAEISCKPTDDADKIKAAFMARFERPIEVKYFMTENDMKIDYDSWSTCG